MFISIALSLIALAAGMLLLARTNKENLGRTFRLMSYFIVLASFAVMALSLIAGYTRMILHRAHAENEGNYKHRHKHHRHHFGGGDAPFMRWHEGEREEEDHMGMEHMGRMDHMHGWEDGNSEERQERMVKHLSEKLKLTPDQTRKVEEIVKASSQKEEEIRKQANGDRETLMKLSHENRESRKEAIRKILTPEQLKMFNENNDRMEARQPADKARPAGTVN